MDTSERNQHFLIKLPVCEIMTKSKWTKKEMIHFFGLNLSELT